MALGKFFLFFKKYFAECKPWALGNFFLKFFKTYFAECQRQALGNFFFIFENHIWPSASWAGTRQSPLCRVPLWHSAKYLEMCGFLASDVTTCLKPS